MAEKGVPFAVEPPKQSLADSRADAVNRNAIPLWAQSDIDIWTAHLQNSSYEEAKGSYEDFSLLAWDGNRVVLQADQVDIVVILTNRNGVTFIDVYGEGTTQHYVGIMEGFHEVYITHKIDSA